MYSKTYVNEELTLATFGYKASNLHPGSHSKIVVTCENCHYNIHREKKYEKNKHRCPAVEGNEKRCFKCGEWKKLCLFSKNPRGSGGVAKMCKQCYNSHESVRKSEGKRKARMQEAIQNSDIEYYLKRRLGGYKRNSQKKNVKFDLTVEFLLELWNKQKGCCYYTGMEMKKAIKQAGSHDWDSPSLDRLEPSKGYVVGNVVFCTYAVNSFKQSLNEKQFKDVLKSIKWWFNG